MPERTEYEEDEYQRMTNYDDLEYEESDCNENTYSMRCHSREEDEQRNYYGEEDRKKSPQSTRWEQEGMFGSTGEHGSGEGGIGRIMFQEIEQPRDSGSRQVSEDKENFAVHDIEKEPWVECDESVSEAVFAREKSTVSLSTSPYNYGNAEEGFKKSELLYTTEDALFAFNQFKQKLEKELEIAAVQKRVIAKVTRKKLDDFDLNFYKERIEAEGDGDQEENVAESMRIREILSQSAQSEDSELYKVGEDAYSSSESDFDGNENVFAKSKKQGYIDDVASCSDPSSEEVEELNDSDKDIPGFVTNSSEEDCTGKRNRRDDTHRLYAEKMEAEEDEEMRRLKRQFKRKVISRQERELEMNWEEDSDGYVPIGEMDLEEEGIISSEVDLHGGDDEVEEMEVVEDFVVNVEDDELFEMDEDAIARIKREDAGGFSFADLRQV